MTEKIYFKAKRIREILEIPTTKRKELEIFELADLTYQVNFIKKIREKFSDLLHQQCCKYLTLEKFSKNQYIYEIGDKSNKYYILLKGTVCLYKNNIKEGLDSQNSEDSADDYYHETPKNIRSRFRQIHIKPETFFDYSKEFDETPIRNNGLELTFDNANGLENKNLANFSMMMGKNEEIDKISRKVASGDNFGQESFFTTKFRQMNAVATKKVEVAVLSKFHFKIAFNEMSKRKEIEILDFLQSISIFSR